MLQTRNLLLILELSLVLVVVKEESYPVTVKVNFQ